MSSVNFKNDNSEAELIESLVSIRRVSKVTKGGRTFGFSALVVVGDSKGKVGYGSGSGVEVTDARKKATESAKKNLIRVHLKQSRTLHHDILGVFGSGKVYLRSAPSGTGIIAGGALRSVFECLGVQDVVVKSIGSSNPHNIIKACFNAFSEISSPKKISDKRGLKLSDVVLRRDYSHNSPVEQSKDEDEI